MRDYLIVELLLANGQRPGVIHGVIIDEIEAAKHKVVSNGYHKLFVDHHKTGRLQNATLFIYPEIYSALDIFVNVILPKLPVYSTNKQHITGISHVFQTFNGDVIPSCRITPIVRNYLLKMGIVFIGTATDIRKSAATLTGMFAPDLHETMASFLCHSRKAHDSYYKINLGHDGLSKAFESLATFQSLPDHSHSMESGNRSLPTEIVCQNSVSRSNLTVEAACCENVENPINVLASMDDFMPNQNSDEDDVCLENDHYSTPILAFSSTPNVSINYFPSELCHTDRSIINEVLPASLTSLSSRSTKFPSYSRFADNSLEIPITKLKLPSSMIHSKNNQPHFLRKRNCIKFTLSNFFFITKNDEQLFKVLFEEYIKRVAERLPVTRRDIIGKLYTSDEFGSVLSNLQMRFPDSLIENRICSKIRNIGLKSQISQSMNMDTTSQEMLLNLSENSSKKLSSTHRTRSIFLIRKDEILFRHVFADLIDRFTYRQPLKSNEIIERTRDERFIEVMNRLKYRYGCDAYIKLLTKVRTVGLSRR